MRYAYKFMWSCILTGVLMMGMEQHRPISSRRTQKDYTMSPEIYAELLELQRIKHPGLFDCVMKIFHNVFFLAGTYDYRVMFEEQDPAELFVTQVQPRIEQRPVLTLRDRVILQVELNKFNNIG